MQPERHCARGSGLPDPYRLTENSIQGAGFLLSIYILFVFKLLSLLIFLVMLDYPFLNKIYHLFYYDFLSLKKKLKRDL
jgi:hypothetical protein